MNEYLDLFGTFAKVGVMTFGGGMAMLPILEREIVQNRKWATEEELVDYFAIGQCTPGIIAVNTATFIGQKHRGGLGGIVATLGVVFPSLVIISILAGLITNFSHLAWVQNAFAGIQVCVCVLIFNAVLKLLKKSVVDKRTAAIFLIVMAGSLFGGMATVPFLKNIGLATGWYSQTDLMNMLAVSESTPGPIGINMATYVGFTVAGIPGAVIATIGEVTPSIIVILIVAAMLTKFRNSNYVENAFYGLRPASSGLIGAACAGVVLQVLLRVTSTAVPDSLFMPFSWDGTVSWMGLALAAVLLVLTNWVKLTKKWHPIVFIGLSAAVGVVFRFGGA